MYNILSKTKILVVDDFAQFRQTIRTMLHKLGSTEIDQAANAVEAMKLCLKTDYDIIFCDYNMGDGQDGQQFLEELHHRGMLLKGSLFLMITAETTSAQVNGAVEYRPDAYLTKPFTNELLEQRLKRLRAKNNSLKEIHKAFNKNNHDKALILCDSVMAEFPHLRFSCLRLKSEILELQSKYEELIELYNEVINEQPLLWALVGKAKVYFYQGNIKTSLESFLAIHEKFPQQVAVLDWIAKCQKLLNKTQEAEETLQKAIDISPKSVSRQAELGEIALSLEHFEVAQKAFKSTVDEGLNSCLLQPEHYQKYYENTQIVISNMGNIEKSKMLAHTESVATKMERKYEKNLSVLASNLGSVASIFSSIGRGQPAEKYITKLSKTLENPNCKITQKDFDKIQEQMESFPESSQNERILGKINTRMDEIKDEIKIDIINDKTAVTINREGMNAAQQKNTTEALDKFREAIKLSPKNTSYLLNASQVILGDTNLSSQADLVTEARNYLDTISIEQSGKRWRILKKLKELLPDE